MNYHRLLLCVLALASGFASLCEAKDLGPLPVTEIASRVFVYEAPVALASPDNEGAIANTGFVIGQEAVAVVDTGGSLAAGRRLLAAIRERTALPIRYVINTHVHPDHLLGNAAFQATGATFVGHQQLPAALAARTPYYLSANRALIGDVFEGTVSVPPTLLVERERDLDLGQRVLRLEAWPTAHTNSDVTVRDLRTDTWFMGDLVFVNHVPALDGRLIGWRETLQRLRTQTAARVVPGHGPKSMPWPAAAEAIERYLARLESDLRRMIRDGSTLQEATREAAQSERSNWSLFTEFNARNATSAYQELEWNQ
jgi:quinoprotein relay system zinc metallohydrolase 2